MFVRNYPGLARGANAWVVRLSKKCGIINQYTSKEQVGKGAVGQARTLSITNYPAILTPRRTEKVAQVGTKTFFNKDGLWMDSRSEGKLATIKVERFSRSYFQTPLPGPADRQIPCPRGEGYLLA